MQENEILTATELAKKLKVSKAAVRRWTLDGLPCRRLGGRLVRFALHTALAWLEQRQQEEN
jgi:excisionase family DNA binding protein